MNAPARVPSSVDAEPRAEAICERFGNAIRAVIDAGACPMQPTTVVDLSSGEPQVLREGRGDLARLGLVEA